MVLAPLAKQYDLIILDCPPTINILAENIFAAADHLLTPLIPTTLSLCAYEQMLAFLKESRDAPKKVYAFFSMVDGRKKMHRQTSLHIQNSFEHILDSAIPYLVDTTRQPDPPALTGCIQASSRYRRDWPDKDRHKPSRPASDYDYSCKKNDWRTLLFYANTVMTTLPCFCPDSA
jgi:cellulose biosynthesis protein BcsQ